jgi:hypothetical protein
MAWRTSGRPGVSSTISTTFRPAIVEPISSRYIVRPLTMSLAACAAGPVRSVVKPIIDRALLTGRAAGGDEQERDAGEPDEREAAAHDRSPGERWPDDTAVA